MEWLTTAEILKFTTLGISQDSVKKAAQRQWAKQEHDGNVPVYVRKDESGHWLVRADWEAVRKWKAHGAARAADVRARHDMHDELLSLRRTVEEQKRLIARLEAELAEAKKAAGKGADVVPPDVLESDEALYDYWIAQGRPSYRTFAEKVGMKKSTVGERILKARKAHGEA